MYIALTKTGLNGDFGMDTRACVFGSTRTPLHSFFAAATLIQKPTATLQAIYCFDFMASCFMLHA